MEWVLLAQCRFLLPTTARVTTPVPTARGWCLEIRQPEHGDIGTQGDNGSEQTRPFVEVARARVLECR